MSIVEAEILDMIQRMRGSVPFRVLAKRVVQSEDEYGMLVDVLDRLCEADRILIAFGPLFEPDTWERDRKALIILMQPLESWEKMHYLSDGEA